MKRPGRAWRAGAGVLVFGAVTAIAYSIPLTIPAVGQSAPFSCRTALEGSSLRAIDDVASESCCYLMSELDWYSANGVVEDSIYRVGGRNIQTEACTGSIANGFGPDSLIDGNTVAAPVEVIVPDPT